MTGQCSRWWRHVSQPLTYGLLEAALKRDVKTVTETLSVHVNGVAEVGRSSHRVIASNKREVFVKGAAR
jgi:hypothetical protein